MKRVPVTLRSVESFYHLQNLSLSGRHCAGLACFAARKDNPDRWNIAAGESPRIYCLGKCYGGPSSTDEDARPRIECRAGEPVLLDNVLRGGVHSIVEYRARGGGEGLLRALAMRRDQVIETVTHSGLRGRGGAGFPTGRKWQAVAQQARSPTYVVVNADEGDPGSFSDRFLIEDDPFLLIEGAAIAAHAVGANRGYIYLRKEYPLARERLQVALSAARAAGMLGERIFNSGFSFYLEIVTGEGSYLCGEETAMLNAIEGNRAEARSRPPNIFERGLFNAPTLVNNVETLCAVPWILRHGADAYHALGFAGSRGTKLISLSSVFQRPGLYEVEFGISLREIVDNIGGGLKHRALRALMIGGPLAGLIPSSLLNTRFGYEELQAIGAAVGHGGVIAFSEDTSIADIAREVFRFGTYESCGKCTPCHQGSPVIEQGFVAATQRVPALARAEYNDIITALAAASLCGHGRGLAEFAHRLERHFGKELEACLV